MTTKPKVQPFDIVHPALKKECSVVVCSDSRPHRCSYCRDRFIYQNYLHQYSMDYLFCSWDCAIEFGDFVNWQYEMERKGYNVDLKVWRATENGTRYFEMLKEESLKREMGKDGN